MYAHISCYYGPISYSNPILKSYSYVTTQLDNLLISEFGFVNWTYM